MNSIKKIIVESWEGKKISPKKNWCHLFSQVIWSKAPKHEKTTEALNKLNIEEWVFFDKINHTKESKRK